MKMKTVGVLELLNKYKSLVEKSRIQFVKKKSKEKGKIIGCLEKLIADYQKAGKTSEPQNWHEVHVEGRELWETLASCALNNIDPGSKGNSKLFEFLKPATEFEDILYGLEPYYRDHMLHSLWVYLLGEYILREHLPNIHANLNWYLYNDIKREENDYDYPEDLVKFSVSKKIKLRKKVDEHRDAIWCIIALCHDLGYSLAKLADLNKKVEAVLKYFDVADFRHVGYSLAIEHQYLVEQFLELMAMDVRIVPAEGYEGIAGEWEKLIQNPSACPTDMERLKDKFWEGTLDDESDVEGKRIIEDFIKGVDARTLIKCYRDDSTYWRLCRALEKRQHGILSAYLIYKILGIFADSYVRGPGEEWGLDDDEAKDNIIRGNILFAVAQHEFDFAHLNQLSSLADILFIADELEEFSRLGRQLLSRQYHPTTANVAIEFRSTKGGEIECGDNVKITIHYTAQHKERKDFLDFFRRKAEQLCGIYSLEQEKDGGLEEYSAIEGIEMHVAKEGTKEEYWFRLCDDRKNNKGYLPKTKITGIQQGTYLAGERDLVCYDDELHVLVKDKEFTLKDWIKGAIGSEGTNAPTAGKDDGKK